MKSPPFTRGSAWSGLVIVYLGFMAMGATFHQIPPILPTVIADLGLSHGQGGMLMSLFALPGIVLSMSGGWLVDRHGARVVGSLGLLVMGAASMGLARAEGFSVILAARLLTGVGAVLAVLALQRMITRLFEGRPLGLPTGVAGSAVPFGIVLIYNSAGPLAASGGWRAVPWRTGLATLLVALFFFLASRAILGRRVRRATVAEASGRAADRPSPWRLIWLAGLIWFLVNGAMTAFLTFAPDHFLEQGLGLRERGLITSVPLWGSALAGPLVGWWADRRGGKGVFITAGMALLTLNLLLVAQGAAPPLVVALGLGASMALVVTPLLSLPGEVLPPSHHGRGFGILSTCANTGIFLLPPAAGAIRDGSAGYFWPFVMMAAVALAGVAAGLFLVRLQGKQEAA